MSSFNAPAEASYKRIYGVYPDVSSMVWIHFLNGWNAAKA